MSIVQYLADCLAADRVDHVTISMTITVRRDDTSETSSLRFDADPREYTMNITGETAHLATTTAALDAVGYMLDNRQPLPQPLPTNKENEPQ